MTNRIALRTLLPLALALSAGCSDGPLAAPATSPVASVEVAPDSLDLEVGSTFTLTATARGRDGAALAGRRIDWSSSDTTVATVSPQGEVSARGAGAAEILARSEGKTGRVSLTVGARAVAWILIVPAGGSIPQDLGTSRQLSVVARALDGTELPAEGVAWSSSDPAVASVSATGLLEARSVGTATVTATLAGKTAETTVWVPSDVATVEMSHAELSLATGDEASVSARALDEDGNVLQRAFTWSSSNPSVATVDAGGRVRGVGDGVAVITAASEGKRGTTDVTVATWREAGLLSAGGEALPAILYTTTETVGGVERTVRFDVAAGSLRHLDGRWTLRLRGRRIVEGAEPVEATLSSEGVLAYDLFTGAPVLVEGDDWKGETRFPSVILPDGRLELAWRRAPGAEVVPLVFEGW